MLATELKTARTQIEQLNAKIHEQTREAASTQQQREKELEEKHAAQLATHSQSMQQVSETSARRVWWMAEDKGEGSEQGQSRERGQWGRDYWRV
jgi:Skp family chaperone for outer membrane proteins